MICIVKEDRSSPKIKHTNIMASLTVSEKQ